MWLTNLSEPLVWTTDLPEWSVWLTDLPECVYGGQSSHWGSQCHQFYSSWIADQTYTLLWFHINNVNHFLTGVSWPQWPSPPGWPGGRQTPRRGPHPGEGQTGDVSRRHAPPNSKRQSEDKKQEHGNHHGENNRINRLYWEPGNFNCCFVRSKLNLEGRVPKADI